MTQKSLLTRAGIIEMHAEKVSALLRLRDYLERGDVLVVTKHDRAGAGGESAIDRAMEGIQHRARAPLISRTRPEARR